MSTPGPPAPSSASIPAAVPTYATMRAILVLFYVIGLNYLCNRHLGIGWDAPAFSLLLAGAGVAIGILEAYWGETEWKNQVSQIARKLVRLPLLLALCASLLIAAGVCSSVTILVDPPDSALSATLSPADGSGIAIRHEDNLSDPKAPVRFLHVWTTPLGRAYTLEVKGYLPQIVQVYPVIGASISPRRDLEITPSVLFRPPEVALGPMAGKVRVEIFEESGSGKTLISQNDLIGPNSILLGTEQSVPPSLWEGWRLEILAKGVKDEIALAKVLSAWKTAQFLTPTAPLKPGSYIEAIVYNASGQRLAHARFRLTQDRLQDVPLNSEALDSPPPSKVPNLAKRGPS